MRTAIRDSALCQTRHASDDWLLLPGVSFGPKRDYLYAGDRLALQLDWTVEGPVRRHIAVDHLNSTRAIVDDNGNLDEVDYYPFGGFLTGDPVPETTHLFTGHERDTAELASNLDYMHARYFSPHLGRFLSVDPAGGEVDSSQSWNRYSYTLNNPIGMIDPDGRTSWAVGKRVFSVVWQQSKTKAREILKFRAKNPAELREAVSRAMEQVPEGARVALNTSDPAMNETAAKALSSSGRARGPEASPGFTEHFNPADGQFENVHVQSRGDWATTMGKNASFTAALMAAVAPASTALADDPQASFAEVLSAALWDATCALDPVFITEGINWAFELDFDTAAE